MSKKPPQGTSLISAERRVTEWEGYDTIVIHRSELKNAPYNPRRITEDQRARLKKGIKKLKLLAPPSWNVNTGNIVGGHQRIHIIDTLEGTKDYHLTVARVQLSETEEIEANLLLNNQEAQGDFDIEKLEQLFRRDDIDIEATGFTPADIFRLFGESGLGSEASVNPAESLAGELREVTDRGAAILYANRNRDSSEYYLVVVFRDFEDCSDFVQTLGLPDNRYQDGRLFRRLFKATAKDPAPPAPRKGKPAKKD